MWGSGIVLCVCACIFARWRAFALYVCVRVHGHTRQHFCSIRKRRRKRPCSGIAWPRDKSLFHRFECPLPTVQKADLSVMLTNLLDQVNTAAAVKEAMGLDSAMSLESVISGGASAGADADGGAASGPDALTGLKWVVVGAQVYLSVYLSIFCLSICLSVYLSICLSYSSHPTGARIRNPGHQRSARRAACAQAGTGGKRCG